jgi:hypothetical protein
LAVAIAAITALAAVFVEAALRPTATALLCPYSTTAKNRLAVLECD